MDPWTWRRLAGDKSGCLEIRDTIDCVDNTHVSSMHHEVLVPLAFDWADICEY